MGQSITVDKSFAFAVRIVNLYRFLVDEKREHVLSKQLLRSGTSIGANVREAMQSQGKKDFLNKINIALKEAYESYYWIELLHATDYLDDRQKESLLTDCNEITSLLVATVKTTKENLAKEKKRNNSPLSSLLSYSPP